MGINIKSNQKNQYDNRTWLRMINSLSGFKSANLIGTIDSQNITNLSIVSSVFHLGANPPLMGFIVRPHSDESPRHTLINIKETQYFTINMVTERFYKKAHQTSARYKTSFSEFSACQLEEEYLNSFIAPYVKESPLKIGLKLMQVIDITHNGTHMVIGEVIEFHLADKKALQPDGYIDIESLHGLCISGLDRYHLTRSLNRLSYAKPDVEIYEIPLKGE